MSGFFKVESLRGVDDGGSRVFMMLPAGSFNLVAHDFGEGAAISAARGLSVLDLTSAMQKSVGAAAAALITALPKHATPQMITERLQNVRTKLPGLGSTSRLLSISGRTPGRYSVRVHKGRNAAELDIAVAERLTRTVTFLFLRYTGTEPARDGQSRGSAHTPTEAKDLLNSVNDIFEPQANIHFDLVKAEFLDQIQPFGAVFTPKLIEDRKLKEKIDQSADWTVFFVPQFDDGAGFAATLGPAGTKKVPIFIPDDAKRAVMVADVPNPYAMIIAHELGHALGIPGGGSHPTREGTLAASRSPHGKEGILIDKTILTLINPPSAKRH